MTFFHAPKERNGLDQWSVTMKAEEIQFRTSRLVHAGWHSDFHTIWEPEWYFKEPGKELCSLNANECNFNGRLSPKSGTEGCKYSLTLIQSTTIAWLIQLNILSIWPNIKHELSLHNAYILLYMLAVEDRGRSKSPQLVEKYVMHVVFHSSGLPLLVKTLEMKELSHLLPTLNK